MRIDRIAAGPGAVAARVLGGSVLALGLLLTILASGAWQPDGRGGDEAGLAGTASAVVAEARADETRADGAGTSR